MQPEFLNWAKIEGDRIADELRGAALRGVLTANVHFIPASGANWARLALTISGEATPSGATDVIVFRNGYRNVCAVAYADIISGIVAYCQRLPVYPVAPAPAAESDPRGAQDRANSSYAINRANRR